MNIYCLSDYEDSVWLTHELEMNQDELRGLLLSHLKPLAEAQRVVEDEGRARFGNGARFCHVRDGKVVAWSPDNDGEEVAGADPVAFEEWQERLWSFTGDGFDRLLQSAGFTRLKPIACMFCPDRSPLEMLERMEVQS